MNKKHLKIFFSPAGDEAYPRGAALIAWEGGECAFSLPEFDAALADYEDQRKAYTGKKRLPEPSKP